MFCSNCRTEMMDNNNYCPKCGNSVYPSKNIKVGENSLKHQENGRGTLILILGIFSFLFGPLLGIPAWVLGHIDLKKIKNGIIDISEKTKTQAGMILGIIFTIIPFIVIILIFGFAAFVGINLNTVQSRESNRDAVYAGCVNLAALAQQYYRKPAAMGGGGQSFIGFSIPNSLETNVNGTYSIENIESQTLSIVGIGIENGNDDETPIKIVMLISPNGIENIIVN